MYGTYGAFSSCAKIPMVSERMQILKTPNGAGHYCFPSTDLVEKKAGYYVDGNYMGLEDSRRNPKTLELESTFRMLLIKKKRI